MKKNRRDFLKSIGTAGAGILAFPYLSCQTMRMRKNVLFIIVDDLRPQMGCYADSLPLHGQQLIKIPNIDNLAKDGVLFERAYCAVPVCAASRLSLFTGARPYKEPGKPWGRNWAYYSRPDHEARQEPAGINHPGESITMPQHFKNHGYKTLSIGKVYHDIRDDDPAWDDKIKLPQESWRSIPAFEIGKDEKDDNYYVDGRTTNYVIDRIGKLANYNTAIQSPLIINDPEIEGNKHCSALVEYVDLYPTLCDLTGLERPTPSADNDGSRFNLHGTSLVPLLKNPYTKWKQAIFSRYHFGDTIRTEQYTCTEYVDEQDNIIGRMLYDHGKDPHENYNIADLNPDLVARLSELLGKGPVGKRNAWRQFVDESRQNTPLTEDLNLPAAIYPENNYPGNGQGR